MEAEQSRGRDASRECEEEEGVRARVSNTDAVPTAKEVAEHIAEHATLRSLRWHCVTGRPEALGQRSSMADVKGVPAVLVACGGRAWKGRSC